MGFDLFVPEFRSAFSMSTSTVGLVSSFGLLGFLLGLLIAQALLARRGPEAPVPSGLIAATVGMGIVALEPNLFVLAIGVFLAASSAGFAWTPFYDAVHRKVRDVDRATALSEISVPEWLRDRLDAGQGSVMEFWQFARPSVTDIERIAVQCEAAGFDGLALTDSQNLSPDTYVALTLAARATTRLKVGPGVTNPLTRHAAVAASAIASLHELSGGRAVLGIGRGDSSLFNIGHRPVSPPVFEQYVEDLQAYLGGETIDKNGYPSRLHWLDAAHRQKVELDVAASGPKVIGIGARHAERVSFALGAEPQRVQWAIEQVARALPDGAPMPSLGLYLNVCVHDDLEQAGEMVRAGVGIFAHFTGMPGAPRAAVRSEDRGVYDALADYDKARHGHTDAEHAQRLPLEFIERFAIIGPPERCIRRLRALIELGIRRVVVIGPREAHFGVEPQAAMARFAAEVMPALRGSPLER
jgi:5,10-methylenetetrahydromethanopterin reductase